MPILYVHGVSVRDRCGFEAMKEYLRRLVAPALSPAPEEVWIEDVVWYPYGVKFAWEGISRPRSRLLSQGADTGAPKEDRVLTAALLGDALKAVPQPATAPAAPGGLSAGRATGQASLGAVHLKELKPQEQSDLVAVVLEATIQDPAERARIALLADELLHSAEFQRQLAQQESLEAEMKLLGDSLKKREAEAPKSGLAAQGARSDWWAGIRDRVGESLSRGAQAPQYAVSIALAELRPCLNDAISRFLGDVFYYLNDRGDASRPGNIPQAFLTKLDEAWAAKNKGSNKNEPLVVISHSMGGQIVYDAITHFLPKDEKRKQMKIDFWAAIASQVGFFEEAKLFLERNDKYKTGSPVPFPSSNLKAWWNVWDQNDVLSFTTRGIMEGVDDGPFDCGMSLLSAHSGYFTRPSFYRELAAKLRAALKTSAHP